jgi:hypothetical protein
MSASIHHSLTLATGSLASSIISGRNNDMIDSEERIFNSYAQESTLNFKNRNGFWTRIENLDKNRTLLYGETPKALEIEEAPIGQRRQRSRFGIPERWRTQGICRLLSRYQMAGRNAKGLVALSGIRKMGIEPGFNSQSSPNGS